MSNQHDSIQLNKSITQPHVSGAIRTIRADTGKTGKMYRSGPRRPGTDRRRLLSARNLPFESGTLLPGSRSGGSWWELVEVADIYTSGMICRNKQYTIVVPNLPKPRNELSKMLYRKNKFT